MADYWDVYCESVCRGENSYCAWGAVIQSPDGQQQIQSGFIGDFGTSETAAVIAATEALKFVPEYQYANLYSSDHYTIDSIEKSLGGWIQRGWRTKTGPVAHKKLWIAFNDVYKPRNIKLHMVRDIQKSQNSQTAQKTAEDKLIEYTEDPVDSLIALLVKNLKRYESNSVIVNAAELYLQSKKV